MYETFPHSVRCFARKGTLLFTHARQQQFWVQDIIDPGWMRSYLLLDQLLLGRDTIFQSRWIDQQKSLQQICSILTHLGKVSLLLITTTTCYLNYQSPLEPKSWIIAPVCQAFYRQNKNTVSAPKEFTIQETSGYRQREREYQEIETLCSA